MQPAQAILCSLVVGAAATHAAALAAPTATWVVNVQTTDGDNIIECALGESSVTVTLSIDFMPNVNAKRVLGLSHAVFDVLGGLNAATGNIGTWDVPDDLTVLVGDLTTTDGVSLYGVSVGQLPVFGPFDPSDPIKVLQFTWTTANCTPRKVNYKVNTLDLGVWTNPPSGIPQVAPWNVVGGDIVFFVQ